MQLILMPFPHPDTAAMPAGLFALSPADVASVRSHVIVVGDALPGSVADRDSTMLRIVAAVIGSIDAVGAMFSHGVSFIRSEAFSTLTSGPRSAAQLPLVVDRSFATERRGMSILTHGMARQNRLELLVACASVDGDAITFVYDLAYWLLSRPELPDGDTVGRSSDERISVRRVPNPIDGNQQVLRLEMPARSQRSARRKDRRRWRRP